MVLATKRLIHIRLLNEGTLVFRPTLGEMIEKDVYKVLPTENYDQEDERWEFPPGKIVLVKKEKREDREILVAFKEL